MQNVVFYDMKVSRHGKDLTNFSSIAPSIHDVLAFSCLFYFMSDFNGPS